MTRHSHYLRRSKSVGTPKIQVALSIVPTLTGHNLTRNQLYQSIAAWSAVAWGEGLGAVRSWPVGHGTTVASFWDWLPRSCRKGRCTWVWQLGAAHGLTLLDFWDRLNVGLWKLDGSDPTAPEGNARDGSKGNKGMCVIEDPPTIILARPSGGPGMVKWVDARNIGAEEWESICAETGIETVPTRDEHGQLPTLSILASQRAVALRMWLEAYERLVEDLDLGGLRHTAAAQSWHGWRYGYLNSPCLCHADEVATVLETESLHAGRCEAYSLGLHDGPIYHLDASSHYPACAAAEPLPCRLCGTGVLSVRDYCELREAGWAIIARCTLELDLPLFPHRGQWITTFPVGRFRTTLAGPELDLAVANGFAKDIGLAAWYETMKPFEAYIARLWRERLAADRAGHKARKGAVKRLLNSLIGKCAQRSFRWVDYPYPTPFSPFETWQGENPETGESCRWRSISWHTQYEQVNGLADDSLPAIASWVYSVSRLRLLNWIETAGWENVLYVDTDSLFCREPGFHRLLQAGEIQAGTLGGLSVRCVGNHLDIRGHKHYTLDGATVCSGVPKGAEFSPSEGWSFWIPDTLKGGIRRGQAPQAKLTGYRMPDGRNYRHGVVNRDGTVSPLQVWEV